MAGASPRYLPKTKPAAFPPVPPGREGLPELGGVYVLLGPPKHGKSSVILNIMEAYRDDLATVFVLSPNARSDQTFAPILRIAEEAHEDDPEIVVRTHFNEDDFIAYEAEIKKMPPKDGYFHMLILDDVINAIPAHSGVWGMLSRWRHLGLTVLMGTQKLRGALPKLARQMTSCWLVLGCASSEEKELNEELSPLPATRLLQAAKTKYGHFGWLRYMPYDGLCWAAPGDQFDTSQSALVWEQNKGDYDSWEKSVTGRRPIAVKEPG
jgi:hypothetical protein